MIVSSIIQFFEVVDRAIQTTENIPEHKKKNIALAIKNLFKQGYDLKANGTIKLDLEKLLDLTES